MSQLPDLQKLPAIQIRKMPSTRFQGAEAPQIDKGFLKVASAGVEAAQKKEEKMRAEQLDFIKTMTDNDAENDVIQANAELAQIGGLNTMDKSIQLRQKLAQRFEKRKEKIPEQFHPYVDQIFAKKMTRYNKFAIPYTLGQVKKVHDAADKTYLANSINEGIESSGDIPSYNREHLARVTYAAAKAAQKRFGDEPELIKEAVSRSISETHRRSVESQAFAGRFDNAIKIIETFEDEFTPADLVKARKLIDQARSDLGDKEASTLARMAMIEGGGDFKAGMAYVAGAARNDKVRRSAEFFFKTGFDTDKRAKEMAIESIHARANQAIARGENPEPIIMELPPGEERDKAINRYNENRGRENIITDWQSYDRLSKRMSSALSARELPDDLIDSHRHLISPRDMKPLEERFNRLKETDNKEALRVNRLAYEMADRELEAFAKENKVRGADRGKLQGAVYDEVGRLITLGGKFDTTTFRSRIRNTMRENAIKEVPTKKWFFFDSTKKEVQKDLSPDNLPAPHASWVDAIRQARPHYTEAQINAAIAELRKANVDVTMPR